MIVDLNQRTTSDWNKFESFKKSSDSLIYIDQKNIKGIGASCLDFTVGGRWFNQSNSQWYTVPENGITLKPNESITIETNEIVGLPLNIFGVVSGVGRNIYTGGIVSPGKIDPGFNGKLRIAFLNSSRKKTNLPKGSVLCACYFIQTETSISAPLTRYIDETETLPNPQGFKAKKFFIANWDKIISITIASLSFVIAYLAFLTN